MLAYVRGVQREEIRVGLDCVKHQDMVSEGTIHLLCTQLGFIPVIFIWIHTKYELRCFMNH